MFLPKKILEKAKSAPKRRILLVDGHEKNVQLALKKLKKFKNFEFFSINNNNFSLYKFFKGKNVFCKSLLNDLPNYINLYKEILEQKAYKKGEMVNFENSEIEKEVKKIQNLAMLMLKNNEFDIVIGGFNHSTAEILKAVLNIIGLKQGVKTLSSVMAMHKRKELLFFSDVAVIPAPTKEQLVEIANETALFVKNLDIEPRLAFLSFSTLLSAKTPQTLLINEAAHYFKLKNETIKSIGDIQLDAALNLEIRKKKYKESSYNEVSNCLIFPNLNSANIGYKLIENLASYDAIGPILLGCAKPVSDLSRGSSVNDIAKTIILTAIQ